MVFNNYSVTPQKGVLVVNIEERWLSVEEIAAHLGVSKETIYRWLESQKIPAHRVGRLWKFQKEEINNWVIRGHAGKQTSESEKPT